MREYVSSNYRNLSRIDFLLTYRELNTVHDNIYERIVLE